MENAKPSSKQVLLIAIVALISILLIWLPTLTGTQAPAQSALPENGIVPPEPTAAGKVEATPPSDNEPLEKPPEAAPNLPVDKDTVTAPAAETHPTAPVVAPPSAAPSAATVPDVAPAAPAAPSAPVTPAAPAAPMAAPSVATPQVAPPSAAPSADTVPDAAPVAPAAAPTNAPPAPSAEKPADPSGMVVPPSEGR